MRAYLFPLALTGCTLHAPMELATSCVSAPRDDFELQVQHVPFSHIDQACRRLLKAHGHRPMPYILFSYGGCVVTWCDWQLGPGERPVCQMIVPEGTGPGDAVWEHELEHCRGYVHP